MVTMTVRETPGSKNGHVGVYSDNGDLLFAPKRCVAAVLTDRHLIAWCTPRSEREIGQARGGPWFVEKYQIPDDESKTGEWPFAGGYEIRNLTMMGWCWTVRIKAPKKYKFRIVVLEGRSEDFRDSTHVVLHDDGRFSETQSLEAAQCLLSQPQAELERWSGDYTARFSGEPVPHWGLSHAAFFAIWISPDTLIPTALSNDHPRAEGTRQRLFPFGERERLTLWYVGSDPSWLWEQPELAPVRHLTIYAPYVTQQLFDSMSLWLPWFRTRQLESLAFGQGKDHTPFIALSWDGDELVCTLANAKQAALDDFLAEHPEPLVDVVRVLGGGLETGTLAERAEEGVDHAKIEAFVADVEATLEGEVLHLRRRSYHWYQTGKPFPVEAFEPALDRHWVGNPKQLKAALRVTPEGVEAFWSLSARRGIEVLNIQTERRSWYRRTASGWRSEDGFLEVIGPWLAELPDPTAEKIRLYLDVLGIKTADLLKTRNSLLWDGYDVCLGPSRLPYARISKASEYVSSGPNPALPPLGKLVEVAVRGHGAGQFRVKYLKRTKRLECATVQSVEAPTPRTLAGAIALHPPPGPVEEATFRVPLLELALCLGEWLQLSAVREDLKLPDLEVVQFTTKAKDSPITELRYADGKVNGVIAMEHLGPSEIVHEVLRDLPQGMFQELRVEHENPLSPELRAVLQQISSSDVDWAPR